MNGFRMPARAGRRSLAGFTFAVIVSCGGLTASAQPVTPVRPGDYERHTKPLEPGHRAAPARLPERVIPESVDDKPLTTKPLGGVRFVPTPGDVVKVADKPGIEIKNIELLDNDEFRALIKPYLGKPISWRLISQMIRDTIMYYRSKGRPVVDVITPQQDITSGVVQLLVVEARVGEVKVQGLKWFSKDLIRSQVRLKRGDFIDARRLLEDIDYINNNPFRFVRPVLQPGKDFGTTDVILDSKDRFPVRFYAGYDDTGSRATGLERFFFGFNMGNVLGRGHEVGYQYTTNKSFDSLGIHSAYWRIPLPNRDTLALFGNIACYDFDRTTEGTLDSHNWMAHVRYISELPSRHNLRHEVEFGLDFRRMDNDLQVGGVTVYDDFIDVAQFAFQYGGRVRDRLGDTSWTLNLYWSPCADLLSNDQNDEKYEDVRPGSKATYVYSHVSIERLWVLPRSWSFFNRVTAQIASERLTPSEQLGLGGYNRVRGYDDFEVRADNGLMATLELRTPEWRLGTLGLGGKLEHFLQLLVFCDYGWGRNRGDTTSDAFRSIDMLSVGPGLRYRISRNLQVRFDFGQQLETIPNGKSTHRCNMSVILSY